VQISFQQAAIVLVTADFLEGELIAPIRAYSGYEEGAALLQKDPESTAEGFPEGDGKAVAAEGAFCISEFRIWEHLEAIASFGLYIGDEFVVDFNAELEDLGDGRYEVDLACRETSPEVFGAILSVREV